MAFLPECLSAAETAAIVLGVQVSIYLFKVCYRRYFLVIADAKRA